jgi:hypothetical protein
MPTKRKHDRVAHNFRCARAIALKRSEKRIVPRLSSRRCSERSYLFTMSDITRAAASRTKQRGSVFFRRTSWHPGWWSQTGSNRRPPACKAGALPTELWPRSRANGAAHRFCRMRMVGLGRLELPTSRLSSARSNQLSYKPENWHEARP